MLVVLAYLVAETTAQGSGTSNVCPTARTTFGPLIGLTNAAQLGDVDVWCQSIMHLSEDSLYMMKSCGEDLKNGIQVLEKHCKKDSEHHGNHADKGRGGIRITQPDASIELHDVKISRTGYKKIMVENFMDIKGMLSTNNAMIDGVDLDTLVRKWTEEVLAERALSKKL